jgi:hypothetical protein
MDAMQKSAAVTVSSSSLSLVIIQLMKGVVYESENPKIWQDLINLQNQVRDYLKVINVRLMLSEDEGFAWLSNRSERSEDDESLQALPKLISKRELSYPVSLLLVLFRQKLLEHDSSDASTVLVLEKEEIAQSLGVFFNDSGNEVKFQKQLDSHLNKIVELGFIRKLRNSNNKYEIKRIIASFIDAEWLNKMDALLEEYLKFGNPQSTAAEAEPEKADR